MTTTSGSPVRHDRIRQAQALMREQGVGAIVVLNHDDYRWFFGFDRTQPRAIIPATGAPALVAFTAEEAELREAVDDGEILVWGSVGGQINDVVTRLRALRAGSGEAPGARFRVGMQQWFDTPAFLVDLFRKVNPGVEVVSSDPIMDPLRAVKEPAELASMTVAQRIAGIGDGSCPLPAPRRDDCPRDRDRGDLRDDGGGRGADEHARLRQRRSRDVHAPRRREPAADAHG